MNSKHIRFQYGARFLIGILTVFTIYGTAVSQPSIKVFYVGYSTKLFTGVDLNDVQVAIDMWSAGFESAINDELDTNYRLISQFIKDDERLLKSPDSMQMDLISVTAIDYVRFKNKTVWKPMFFNKGEGKAPEPLLLLVHADKEINKLNDLQNKTILFPKDVQLPLIQLWLDNLLLADKRQMYKQHFKVIKSVLKSSNAVLDVFFGKADACVVGYNAFRTMTELNPQLGKVLKVVQKSAPFLHTVTCVNTRHNRVLQSQLLRTAIELPLKPKGRQILALFGGKEVIAFKDTHVESLIELINTNKKLTKANKDKQ